MDFANERYVRLYVRDTVTWLRLGWDGQNALTQLLRKADRAGVLDLGGMEPWEALVVLCRAPEDAAKRGVQLVLDLGCAVHDHDRLVFPRYLDANECTQTGAQRTREYRARRAEVSRNVTGRDETSQNRDELKRPVTSGDSVPCRAMPSVPSRAVLNTARAHEAEDPGLLKLGMDFMQAIDPSGYWDIGTWRRELELIGGFPPEQRQLALATIQRSEWCRANDVKPSHVVKYWSSYARGREAVNQIVTRQAAGMAPVSSAEEFAADAAGRPGPWET